MSKDLFNNESSRNFSGGIELLAPFADADYTSLSSYDHPDVSRPKEPDIRMPELVLLDDDWTFLTYNMLAMILSLTMNTFVIYFICGQKRARSAQNIAIVSIAVADILVAAFVVPTHVVIHTLHAERYSDDLSPFLCKMHMYSWFWCKTVTVYSICALICDRYSRVTHPQGSHLLSGRYMFFLAFVWFFGAAYNVWQIILKLSDYVKVSSDAGRNFTVRTCVTADQFRYLQPWLSAGDILVMYTIPLVVSVYMFGAITRHLWRTSNNGHRTTSKKRLLLSIFLLLLFFTCQMPLDVINILIFVKNKFSYDIIMAKKVAEMLAMSQGVLNVVVYALFSSEFHVSVSKQLGRTKGCYYARVNVKTSRTDGCVNIPRIEVRHVGSEITTDSAVEMTVMAIQRADSSTTQTSVRL